MINSPIFGKRPGKEYEEILTTSPQFDLRTQSFFNQRPHVLNEMRKRALGLDLFKEWFFENKDRLPRRELPLIRPDLFDFQKTQDDLKVIWFGHSTLLLNMSGKLILIDPVFSSSASPFEFMIRRFQQPPLALSELPPIDYILLSHDHYDHLDMEVIKFFKTKNVQFLCPLGVGSHLTFWGVNKDQIIELDWWQSYEDHHLIFRATPAQHYSGRNGIDENKTLWASWVIEDPKFKVFFSGDSGYCDHFKEIGKRYGPFDLAFIETGQYNEKWKEIHMLPQESIQAFYDLGARRYFPIHWGMFVLAFHSWYDPIEKMYEAARTKNLPLVAPQLGEIYSFKDPLKEIIPWWRDYI
jgi:L-ascorbate metabolism protein UlaG (beta-lactamase superfamily)